MHSLLFCKMQHNLKLVCLKVNIYLLQITLPLLKKTHKTKQQKKPPSKNINA